MSPLTQIILLPLLAAVAVLFLPRAKARLARPVALAATGIVAFLACSLVTGFDQAPEGPGGYRFVQQVPWIESLGISYFVGVDGLNLGLVVMGALVAFAAVCVSREIGGREREFFSLLLFMVAGVLGAFASLDLFFFYAFHELALVPTFIMIGVWGRGPQKGYAAFKITIYLSLGALIALLGLLSLYFGTGAETFSLVELTAHVAENPVPARIQQVAFPLLMFGFGILVSLWPFHTWAPLAYAAAPSATAMLHAGVLKKFGLYGLIRVALPLLPEGAQAWLPVLAWLCLGNILYCGLVAIRQRDLNLLIGNSSVAHVGFVFLGIASLTVLGVTGAVVVMIAHGFLAALSFALSGELHARAGTLEMRRFGGLLARTPSWGVLLLVALLAGCGVPGFGNFVGEMMVLFGSWKNLPWFVVAAAWGAMIIAAVYMLRAVRGLLHGTEPDDLPVVADLRGLGAKLPYLILVAGLLAVGLWPRSVTDRAVRPAAQVIEAATRQPAARPVAAAEPAPVPLASVR
ncbi:MAG: NuoM family protein [Limisphaerales bacterium]